MKKTIVNLTVIIIFLILLWIILNNSNLVSKNILIGFNLWLKKVFPTLFPMFIISNILINYGFADYLGKIFSKASTKVFKVNGSCAYVFFMSLISGTPSSAIFVKDLYQNNYLSSNDASKILCFTFFINPLFSYYFLNQILNNYKLSLIIIIICYLTNIIIGLIIRNKYINNNLYKPINNNLNTKDFPTILTDSIKKATTNLILILGTIVFFIMLSALIDEVFNLSNFNNTILKGLLEITGGLENLVTLNTSLFYKALIATFFISFGGLSIHMQIKSIINDTPIKYKLFFISRLVHACIATLLVFIILYLTYFI